MMLFVPYREYENTLKASCRTWLEGYSCRKLLVDTIKKKFPPLTKSWGNINVVNEEIASREKQMFNFIDLTGHPYDALMTKKYDIHHDMDCKLQGKNTLTNVNNAIETISHPFLLYTKTYYEYRKKLDGKQ